MAKAKKLPSGNWRVNQFIGRDVDGKQKFESFTASTKKEAEYMAAEFVMHRKQAERPQNMTVGQAIDSYIESKDAVLSPSTLGEYKRIRKRDLKELMPIALNSLTREIVQREINREAKTHSPKSIYNMHGLLSAALNEYHPTFVLKTTLPPKIKPDIFIPSKDDVQTLMDLSKGTPMELPIILAACMGLRRSEIVGLKWDKINFEENTITISEAIVCGEENKLFSKSPKSYAGSRIIEMPTIVADSLKRAPHDEEYVVTISGNGIYKRFIRLLDKANMQHFRFHDLRHYNASVMLALGVPDKYAMERMGHTTNNMLKTVYQHTMRDEQKKITVMIDDYFSLHESLHDEHETN